MSARASMLVYVRQEQIFAAEGQPAHAVRCSLKQQTESVRENNEFDQVRKVSTLYKAIERQGVARRRTYTRIEERSINSTAPGFFSVPHQSGALQSEITRPPCFFS